MTVNVEIIPKIVNPVDDDCRYGSTCGTTTCTASEATGKQSILYLLQQLCEHDDSKTVLESLRQLANMCFTSDKNRKQNRKDIGRLGGPFTILRAMKKYQANATVQAASFCALGNTACGNDENKSLLIELGAAKSTVLTMTKFAKDEYVSECGCYLLSKLCFWNQAKDVVDAGGIQACTKAMEAYPGNEELQRDSCLVLERMARVGHEVKVKIVKAGGVMLAGKAGQNYFDNSTVRMWAKDTLDVLMS